jgi:hypothetical protein
MKTTETLVWIALFWALYMPATLVLYSINQQGSLSGMLVIGGVLSLVLGVFTKTQNGVMFDDVERVTKLEVYDHGKEERQDSRARNSARPEVGFEPGLPMHTDVDLGQLGADDDDFSG